MWATSAGPTLEKRSDPQGSLRSAPYPPVTGYQRADVFSIGDTNEEGGSLRSAHEFAKELLVAAAASRLRIEVDY